MKPPDVFANLMDDCHPVASKSHRYSFADKQFIEKETRRLLEEGIIEKSNSPWRAQIVVVKDPYVHSKRRLAVDYSQTINRFILLDAYPLPRIDETVNKIAQYSVYSTIDLRSAYHQVPIKPEDKPYTAFEAAGGLYQFTRIPFGVTNGVACFQRKMDELISEEELKGTFAYLDNVTICGRMQVEHDNNLNDFLNAAKWCNITSNPEKYVFSVTELHILGCVVKNGEIRPDQERLRSLQELPVPSDTKAHKRILGFFSYHPNWIPGYSDKIQALVAMKTFPYTPETAKAFKILKKTIEESLVCSIDESVRFDIETDASDFAIAATFNEVGRPVAFFSCTLQGPERRHASEAREAQAIIETVRHWKHYLTGRHFSLKTDQRYVA